MIDDLGENQLPLGKTEERSDRSEASTKPHTIVGGKVSGDAYSGKVQRNRRILYGRRRRYNLLPRYRRLTNPGRQSSLNNPPRISS